MKLAGRLLAYIVLAAVFSGAAFAAHPLITDDTGTQGKSKFQLELNGEAAYDGGAVGAIFSSGVSERIDIVLGAPYIIVEEASGLSDAGIEIKWRFYDEDGVSFAIKPGIFIPLGSDASSDDSGYGASFIITKRAGGVDFHTNFAYQRSGEANVLGASFAAVSEMTDRLRGVFDIAVSGDLDSDEEPPAYIIGGLIYGLSEAVDLDLGLRAGITGPAEDIAFLLGSAWRF